MNRFLMLLVVITILSIVTDAATSGYIVLSGTVPPKPKVETITICDKTGCYQIQREVSKE